MNNNELKNKVQQEAITRWKAVGFQGSVEIITGLGKTFIGLHALYEMPKDDKIHLFLAESKDRKADLIEDIKKYNKIFNRDVLNDYNLNFHCYQSVFKWKKQSFGLVIADEIHDSLSPAYFKFYENNSFDAIIGLSATINRDTGYKTDKGYITKGDYLNKIAPVCFTYGINKAKKEGTTRRLKMYVIHHHLEKKEKTVLAGSKRKRFLQTEEAAYKYWDKEHKKAFYIDEDEIRGIKIAFTARRRSDLLYNLKSKVKGTNKLLETLTNKTIVFGNSIDALLKVTPNVISSRNSDEKNRRIRDSFETGSTQVIGSFKKLKQGANLEGLDNCIIMSYYGMDKDFIQRIGRLRDNGKLGRIFVFVTIGTQEEVWFTKMSAHLDIEKVYCPNVEHCIKVLKHDRLSEK